MKKLLIILAILAGFASTSKAIMYYVNPETGMMDVVCDGFWYITYDVTNYELDISTSVNITGKLTVSGASLFNSDITMGTNDIYGDNNTYIAFADDWIRLLSGGVIFYNAYETGASSYLKLGDARYPTTIYGDTGFGDTSPDAQLEILSNSAPTEYALLVSSQNDSTVLFSVDGNGDITIGEGKLTDSTIVDADIKDDTIQEPALNVTNSPTDNYVLSYNQAGTNFTWVADATGAGGEEITVSTINAPSGTSSVHISTSVDITGELDIIHTSTEADDHALEIDVDAAGFGDVKALDINYITGAIVTGQDEGVILINIDRNNSQGGEIFATEVLATDGSAGVFGLKVGAGIGVIHQDAGTFIDPTTGTDNTTATDVPNMIDGSSTTTTTIFENDDEYILIGADAVFEEIEFIIPIGSGGSGIAPTFGYSISGAHTFTAFTPVDGTNGFKNTGVVAWDASDLVSHTTNNNTGTYDILITRTKNNIPTSPVLGYAKTAATTEYLWTKEGDVNVKTLSTSGQISSNSRKLVDQYRKGVVISSPTASIHATVRITSYFPSDVTITTMTAQIVGGTNVIGMVEIRTKAGMESAGTDMFSGDVTFLPTIYTGGGISDFTIPSGSAMFWVKTSVSGNVDLIDFDYTYTKD